VAKGACQSEETFHREAGDPTWRGEAAVIVALVVPTRGSDLVVRTCKII
jgi:hypothetical protein